MDAHSGTSTGVHVHKYVRIRLARTQLRTLLMGTSQHCRSYSSSPLSHEIRSRIRNNDWIPALSHPRMPTIAMVCTSPLASIIRPKYWKIGDASSLIRNQVSWNSVARTRVWPPNNTRKNYYLLLLFTSVVCTQQINICIFALSHVERVKQTFFPIISR